MTALGHWLHETSRMVLQNRQALDWIPAEKGLCQLFEEHCCTFIPENTAIDEKFSVAILNFGD